MLPLNLILRVRSLIVLNDLKRFLSTTSITRKRHCCKLLIVGGGSGGINAASRFSKILLKHELIIVDPQDIHYYQSHFTLIGAGEKKLWDAVKPALHVMPENAVWLQDLVTQFCPQTNTVLLKGGDIVEYEFMLIAVGVRLGLDCIKGLREALDNYRDVSTIYSPKYVNKVFKSIKNFVTGIALFTAPITPVKCFSASLQICFLAEDYLKRQDKCAEADVTYATAAPTLFPVQVYDDLIWNVARRKRVDVQVDTDLIEVIPDRREAVFECLKNPGDKITLEYGMLHVTPPMFVPDELKNCQDLVDENNYANVDIHTLQHKKFPNVFAIGDCGPTFKNKTISALNSQTYVVFQNISSVFKGQEPKARYEGYTSCPVITGYGTCIFTEFDYTLTPRETFPFKQSYESGAVYYLIKYLLADVYWQLFLKGAMNGMDKLRKILHFGFVRKIK